MAGTASVRNRQEKRGGYNCLVCVQVAGFSNVLIETAITQAKELGEFTIPGLGKLVKAQRAARIGRNPAIGEAIKIKAKTTVKFRLAKAAKDAVVTPKA